MTAPRPINAQEYQVLTKEQLPPMVYDYYAGGAHDEFTLNENTTAYDRLTLRYHVMRDVSQRSMATTVLG